MVEWGDLFYGINWMGFIISFVLLIFIPVWFMDFFELDIGYKLFLTFGGGIATFFIVQSKSKKRGY